MECRLCKRDDPHVHVSDNVVARLHRLKFKRSLRLSDISNVDFGIPAVNYRGRWIMVTPGFLDLIWPKVRAQVLRARPHPEDDEDPEEDDEA
jgi:hypothetical protein